MDFNPEAVEKIPWWDVFAIADGRGEFVRGADYDKLLALHRALQPQMTIAERYGVIDVK